MTFPSNLAFSIHAGISLEDPDWQKTLMDEIKGHGFKLLIFDPLRRFSPHCDGGPTDVRPTTEFLRRLCVETDATVIVVHHDTKPQQARRQSRDRRRSHNASGGDWFAACDCPMSFALGAESAIDVMPEDYKHSNDPEGFVFSLAEDLENAIRLEADNFSGPNDEVPTAALEKKIVEFLANNPKKSGNDVAKGVKANRQAVTNALHSLKDKGVIEVEQKGKTQLWSVREEK